MIRVCPRRMAALVLAVTVALWGPPAFADKRTEAVARQALRNAGNDYRATEYARGAARLEKAIRACGAKRCSRSTKALLLRDLGVMQYRDGRKDVASETWANARALKPDLDLNPDYDAPEVRAAWTQGKQGGPPSVDNPPENLARAAAPPAAAEEKTHAEAEKREVLAPLPNAELEQPEPRFARLWVGVAGALDLLWLPLSTDTCRLSGKAAPTNSLGYYCTNPDGSDFPSRVSSAQNDHLAPDAGHVDNSLVLGDMRLMLAVDYALTQNILAGLRLGFVLNAYTGTAAVEAHRALPTHVHGELRATYVFGAHPLSAEGFAPMIFAGGGISQFDGHKVSSVMFDNAAGAQTVNVWRTDAPAFAMIGGGVRYQFSPRVAFALGARLNAVLGGGGLLLTYGPELTVVYGF